MMGYYDDSGTWHPSSWRDYGPPPDMPTWRNGGMPVPTVRPPSVIPVFRQPYSQTAGVSSVNAGGVTGGPAGVQGVGSMPSVSTFQGQSVPQHGVGNAVGLDYQGPSLRHLSQQEMDAADKILNSSQDAITKALAGGMGWQDIAKLLQGIASGNTTTGGSGGGGSGGTTYAPLSYTPEQYAQFKKANELASGNIGNLYGTASTDIGNLLQQYSDAAAARQAGAQQTLQAFGVAPSAMSVGGLQPQDVLRAYQSKMAADRATQQADLVNQLAAYASAVKG